MRKATRLVGQGSSEVVDVAGWLRDEDFAPFPSGSKPKRAVYCPERPPYPFLVGGHRYMFKVSAGRGIHQHWSEIIAHQISEMVGFNTARCFIAIDSDRGEVGIISEFFYGYPNGTVFPRIKSGADALRQLVPEFDSDPDEHHTMHNIAIVCRAHGISGWRNYWAATLAFDALIGNTDRHSENWAILAATTASGARLSYQLSPSFDHGTSLGYLIREQDLRSAMALDNMTRFIKRGRQLIRVGAPRATGHFEACSIYEHRYPQTKPAMLKTIDISGAAIDQLMDQLCRFDLPAGKLTEARAQFLVCLIGERQRAVAEALGE